jgi:hypothetical protein
VGKACLTADVTQDHVGQLEVKISISDEALSNGVHVVRTSYRRRDLRFLPLMALDRLQQVGHTHTMLTGFWEVIDERIQPHLNILTAFICSDAFTCDG